MQTLPYQYNADLFPHLNAWFRYRTSKFDGFKRLQQIWNGDNYSTNAVTEIVTTSENDYHPLTAAEEHRWLMLERKAKQENLSGPDSAEHDIFLEIKLYHRYKAEYPQLSHQALVLMVKSLL
ncbi:MAG: hypothetical protein V4717_19505 [Bacteroidota bacterium]